MANDAFFVDEQETVRRHEMSEIHPEERLRADFYDFLSSLLAEPPDAARLKALAALEGGADPVGKAASALARIAGTFTAERAEREFHNLFIGLGRGELLPYASYYMSGFLHEKPLARLREDMERLRIARVSSSFTPEDGVASLLSMMAGLIRGRFGAPASIIEQRTFFGAHIGPWAGHFFADLEAAPSAVLYAPIGAMGRALIEIE
ncbi:MAG: molecular chaperone TorD family protein, partial [Neomegalonema sp.]|nr:molecular chaperone TorD family protein [Neomegalonema sp.]